MTVKPDGARSAAVTDVKKGDRSLPQVARHFPGYRWPAAFQHMPGWSGML